MVATGDPSVERDDSSQGTRRVHTLRQLTKENRFGVEAKLDYLVDEHGLSEAEANASLGDSVTSDEATREGDEQIVISDSA